MKSTIQVNSAGQVVSPNLHDSKLIGIVLEKGSRASVLFDSEDGMRYVFLLSGLERLRADEFRQGNIVLDITICQASAGERDEIAYLYDIKSTEVDLLERTANRLALDQKLVVQISTSYGCRLLAICSAVELQAG